jgi:rubrerythrin
LTPKAVIKQLRELIDDRKALCVADAEHDEIYLENIRALKKAMKQMQRQIPKKPKDKLYLYGAIYLCPQCGRTNIEPGDTFCPKCGQALDWSETL